MFDLLNYDLHSDRMIIDGLLEQVTGFEMLLRMRRLSDDTNLQVKSNSEAFARLLVVKWIYVWGYLNDEFPPSKERFTPAHLLENN